MTNLFLGENLAEIIAYRERIKEYCTRNIPRSEEKIRSGGFSCTFGKSLV